ncbi:sulfate permease family, partial [Chrysochromulina tobinii]
MSSPPDTPMAPTRWAAMFEKQAESTVGDYDMRASAAYIRSPVGSPQLRGLQRRELAVPLLGATKAPVAAPAPAALEESGATAALKAILYGFINTIVVTPVMIGFCAIIFRHEAFHRDPTVYAQLVKLCLFSSAVHQAVFTATSSLPFAIGQVQDAGLIFLSKMACDLANEMEHEPPEALLSTVLVERPSTWRREPSFSVTEKPSFSTDTYFIAARESLIYEETIDAVFKADSWAAGLAKLRPYLDANMSKESAAAFQECCGKLFVLSRVHTSMAPEVSFAKVQEIIDALSRECSMASHTAAPLVAGLKRFVEQRILPNGALDHITEHGFRLPADE